MKNLPIALLLLLAAGCTPEAADPYLRPGTWSLTGVNDINLAAMVADPRDLAAGRGTATARGTAAAHPVGLLEAGKRPALPEARTAAIGAVSSGDTGDAGGGGNAQ